jgi:hypothetical protein
VLEYANTGIGSTTVKSARRPGARQSASTRQTPRRASTRSFQTDLSHADRSARRVLRTAPHRSARAYTLRKSTSRRATLAMG